MILSTAVIFKTIGVLGLLGITWGVTTKNPVKQDVLFIVGGILLEIYSIYLHDWVFIVLQVVFILASLYGLEMRMHENKLGYRILKFFHLK